MTEPAPGAGGDHANEQTEAPGASPLAESPSGSPAPAADTAGSRAADAVGAEEVQEQAQDQEFPASHDGTTEATETTETTEGASEEEEDEDEDDDDAEEEEEDDEDEEPRLKYARLTQNLSGVYKNADATSSFLVAGDKMVWMLDVYQDLLLPVADFGCRLLEPTTEIS